MSATLGFPEVLHQDQVWLHGQPLDEMDRHHRANLIPFLRGNKRRFYLMTHRGSCLAEATALVAEEWLAETPLMRRLVELEAGRTIEERRETAARNAATEKATGYQKIRGDEVLDIIEDHQREVGAL